MLLHTVQLYSPNNFFVFEEPLLRVNYYVSTVSLFLLDAGLCRRVVWTLYLLVLVDDCVEELAVSPAGGEVVTAEAWVALDHAL